MTLTQLKSGVWTMAVLMGWGGPLLRRPNSWSHSHVQGGGCHPVPEPRPMVRWAGLRSRCGTAEAGPPPAGRLVADRLRVCSAAGSD